MKKKGGGVCASALFPACFGVSGRHFLAIVYDSVCSSVDCLSQHDEG